MQRFIFMESFFFDDCFDAPGNETMRFLLCAGGREGESIYVLYIRLCPGNIEPRPFYRAELSSPPWYLFNTDATPRQPLLSYRPTCNTCPRGVSLLPHLSRQWKDIRNNNFRLASFFLSRLPYENRRLPFFSFQGYIAKSFGNSVCKDCTRDEIKTRRFDTISRRNLFERSSRENYRGCE